MFGMKNIVKKKKKSHCNDCRNLIYGTGYGKTVCYKLEQRNGREMAKRVEPTKVACPAFAAKEA